MASKLNSVAIARKLPIVLSFEEAKQYMADGASNNDTIIYVVYTLPCWLKFDEGLLRDEYWQVLV